MQNQADQAIAASLELRIDPHCHSFFSHDGISDPAQMVAAAKRRGLHGFAITDHDTCACVDYFLEHGQMRPDGQPVDGFLIIPGQEISTSAGHLLALGVHLPNLKGISPAEAIQIVRAQGGVAIPAHPYDKLRSGIRQKVLKELEFDALEVFNAASSIQRFNHQALRYARQYHLPMTAGSDSHHLSTLGCSYTIVAPKTFTLQAVVESFKQPVGRHQRYMTLKDQYLKQWHLMRRKYGERKA